MFCGNCGKKIPDTAGFCPECGQKVPISAKQNEIIPEQDGIMPEQKGSREARSSKRTDGVAVRTKSCAGAYFFGATLSFCLLPEMLNIIVFCMKRHSLPLWIPICFEIIGVIMGILFLFPAIQDVFGYRRLGISVRTVLGLMPVLLIYLLEEKLPAYMYGILPALFSEQLWIAAVIAGGITLVLVVAGGVAFFCFVTKCVNADIPHPVFCFFRHFLMGLILSLLLVGMITATDLLGVLFQLIPADRNISLHVVTYLCSSLLQAGLLWLAVKMVRRMYRKYCGKKNVQAGKTDYPGRNSGAIPGIVCMACNVVILCCLGFFALYGNPVSAIRDELAEYVLEAEMHMASLDMDGAVKKLNEAEMTMELWREIAGIEEPGYLDSAVKDKPGNEKLVYLSAWINKDTEAIKTYLRVHREEPQMALALLDLYAEQKEEGGATQESEEMAERGTYQYAALLTCVEAGEYTVSWVRPEQIEGHTEALEVMLREFDKIGKLNRMFSFLTTVQQNGRADKEMLQEALQIAEDYPDDWMAQYVAAAIGSEVTYDGAEHYEAVASAAMRYEELYRKAYKISGQTLYNMELSVAQMLMNCYQYEDALTYLEPILDEDKGGSVFILAAECYEQTEQTDRCYEIAESYLGKNTDNAYALYYAALSALKLGESDKALTWTSKLADCVKKSEGEELIYLDTCLYSMLQYITLKDDSRYTRYQYGLYKDLSEQQLADIAKNDFYDNYLRAVYDCFSNRDKESAQTALEEIEKVLSMKAGLPNAWYLKGAILYGMKDTQKLPEAVEAFKKSLAIEPDSPTVWYALANAYDGLEEYELCAEACKRALSMLPETDHGEDWYGIAYHGNKLLNAVESKLN